MHGKPSLSKSLQKIRRSAGRSPPKEYVVIGNWRLEENSDGDLVVRNRETQSEIIIATTG